MNPLGPIEHRLKTAAATRNVRYRERLVAEARAMLDRLARRVAALREDADELAAGAGPTS